MGAKGLECEQKTKSTNSLLKKKGRKKHLKSRINQKNERQYSKLRHGKCI